MQLNKQVGVSLIELLIGIFIGLIVLSGMIYFLSRIASYSTKNLKTVRLEYEIQTALDLMADDIRRAGFSANNSGVMSSGVNNNPFMITGTSDLVVPTSNCILFTYDLNKDGSLPALGSLPSDERFGYRLSAGAIQTRATTDSVFGCTTGNWENLTDPDLLTITNLVFTLTSNALPLRDPITTEAIALRYVNISVAGTLVSDPSVSTTFSTNIKVRNDKYQP